MESLGAGGKWHSDYTHGFISVRSFAKPLAYYSSNRYIDLILAPSALSLISHNVLEPQSVMWFSLFWPFWRSTAFVCAHMQISPIQNNSMFQQSLWDDIIYQFLLLSLETWTWVDCTTVHILTMHITNIY